MNKKDKPTMGRYATTTHYSVDSASNINETTAVRSERSGYLKVNDPVQGLLAENRRLRADNASLREALEEIVAEIMPRLKLLRVSGEYVLEPINTIARAALAATDPKKEGE